MAVVGMMMPALARARVIVLMIGGVVVGLAAGGVFDEFQWPFVVAPVMVSVAMLALVDRRVALRLAGAVVAIVGAVTVAVVATDGSLGAVVDAFTAGPQRLLSTEWPSPVRGDLVGTVTALLATSVAISDELARRARWHLAPLLPLVVAGVIVTGLSAPLGVRWAGLIAFAVVAVTFAALRDDESLRHRLRLLRGERRLVPLLLIAAMAAALLSVPVALEARADPRRNDDAQRTATLLDPIEATNALRNLDPPITLHQIEIITGDTTPLRWRTAALENYDGVRWTPNLTLRPIGTTLGPSEGDTTEFDVSFLDDNTSLVPFPANPVSVDAAVETDLDRTVVRLLERPIVGEVVAASATAAATSEDAAVEGLAVRPIDDGVAGLSEFANELGGDGSTLEQLRTIEATLRDEWELDSDVQGGGLQQALIERFLRDTRRGNTEQFASGFAILARSLGADARVATGFRAPPTSSTSLALVSSDATVWPEVRLNDGQWLAFDPVPLEEVGGGEPPPPEPQVQTPAAPQPPIPPPPEPSTDIADTDDDQEVTTSGALSAALTWVLRVTVVGGVALLPIVLAAGTILALKQRRRRRRLNAATPLERIRGAWASATDALVDAGLSIRHSSTDTEIAVAAEPIVVPARRQLRRLASMATSATFGSPSHAELLADDAASCLMSVEDTIVDERSRWQRVRWRLSLRSLRTATRSPVTD
jgi:hypothetical protein